MSHKLPKRVKAAREAKGLSTRELDAAAGLSPGHIWLIETGARKNLAAATLSKIAKVLGVSVESLIGADTERKAS